jgi:hypothetical protein
VGRVVVLVETGWGPRSPIRDVVFRADTSIENFRRGPFIARTDARGVAVFEVPADGESWIGAYLFGYEVLYFSVDPWYGGTDSVRIRLRQSQSGENCVPVLPGAP